MLDNVPTAGLTDHVTAVFCEPVTVAANCRVWDATSDAEVGVIDTATGGTSATLALADLVGSAALVALTITVCPLEIELGAV